MTAVRIVVITDAELIQPDACADKGVYFLDGFFPASAARNIRLICHPDEQEARAFEEAAPISRSLDELYFSQISRWIRLPVADNRLIEHAVPVEKYCLLFP